MNKNKHILVWYFIKRIFARMVKLVDTTDLKSVVLLDVPVQVRLRVPKRFRKKENHMGVAIGIDLGTTNSVCAVIGWR